MLRENPDIDRHARWSDVKKKVDSDARYKAVESSTQKEDWFREYCKILKDEKKRQKEKDREHKREKEREKHKKRDKDKDEKHSKEKRKSDKSEKESSKREEKKDDSGDIDMKDMEEVSVCIRF